MTENNNIGIEEIQNRALRQIKEGYGKIIYYQPLKDDLEEKEYSPEKIKKVRVNVNLPYRCYECWQPFLTTDDDELVNKAGQRYTYRREHLFKIIGLPFNDSELWNSTGIDYFKSLCCNCSSECDCQDWITKSQREYEADKDRLERKLKTMLRIGKMLDKEYEFAQYEEEKEVIRNTINWNLGKRDIKANQQAIERVKNTLKGLESLEEQLRIKRNVKPLGKLGWEVSPKR